MKLVNNNHSSSKKNNDGTLQEKGQKNKKRIRHLGFPSGLPSQY